MVLKSGDMERCLPKLAWHLEEPRVGQSYPNYYAANLASKFVKVVLSGSGGDELLVVILGGIGAVDSKNFNEFIDNYYMYWQWLVDNSQLHKMFGPISKEVKVFGPAIFLVRFSLVKTLNFIRRMTILIIAWFRGKDFFVMV